MKTLYERILILGTGQLAQKCAQHLKEYPITAELFDANPNKSALLEKSCIHNAIPYQHLPKNELMGHINAITKKTLIISAFNPYLIPKSILDRDNITAINCHHAILPNHPGRNSEAWAIYEQDKEAGVTWHYITPEVDAGNIIIIKREDLNETITSIQLLRRQHHMALEGFKEIIEALLQGEEMGTRQDMGKRGKLHYSYDVPNNGVLDPNWKSDKISAFLRAMDYGTLEVLGKPELHINGKNYQWKKYIVQKVENENDKNEELVVFTDTAIIINKPDTKISLLHYKVI